MNGREKIVVRNYTGHPLTITDGLGIATIPSHGRARVRMIKNAIRKLDVDGIEIDIMGIVNRDVIGLPGPTKGVVYVVSGIVADVANRPDVVAPGGLVRDNGNGRVKGCRTLVRVIKEK